VFHVKVLTADGVDVDDITVSKMLHLDKKAKPVEGFWEPGIVCSFIPGTDGNTQDPNLFIGVFHRFERK
jgi:hypothetical protein